MKDCVVTSLDSSKEPSPPAWRKQWTGKQWVAGNTCSCEMAGLQNWVGMHDSVGTKRSNCEMVYHVFSRIEQLYESRGLITWNTSASSRARNEYYDQPWPSNPVTPLTTSTLLRKKTNIAVFWWQGKDLTLWSSCFFFFFFFFFFLFHHVGWSVLWSYDWLLGAWLLARN